MAKSMGVSIVRYGRCAVACVAGDINWRNADQVRSAILRMMEGSVGRVVLDLKAARHIDSAGIATLLLGLQAAEKRNARFILAGLNDAPQRMLDHTRLSGFFQITPTVEEALR